MKSWIKGGLWGLGVYVILWLENFFFCFGGLGGDCHLPFWLSPFNYYGNFFNPNNLGFFSGILAYYIIPLAFLFILGAIIGLIIHKIKSKKQEQIR